VTEWVALTVGLLIGITGGSVAIRAAYHNGVTDGYGYSKEPFCPGYAAAGRYLRKYMAHRWHELRGVPSDE
jgi:hypothetical protein